MLADKHLDVYMLVREPVRAVEVYVYKYGVGSKLFGTSGAPALAFCLAAKAALEKDDGE